MAGVVSCSSNSTKDGGQFSGTWSCPASLAPRGSTLTITENLDGTLTLASPSDGGGTFCPSDNWTFSGSTATIDLSANANGLSCLGPNGTEVVTVTSFSLTANGNTLTVSGKETVSQAKEEPDGEVENTPATTTVVTLSGNCTKA
jgi:hypothetical protein